MAAESYLRRLTRRLTEHPEQRDAEELSDEAVTTGAQRAIDCQRGQEVTVVGTLRSVECNGKGCADGVRAELFDGTDTVALVWLGQRRIPGSSRVARCGCTAGSASWRTGPRRSTTRTTKFSGEACSVNPATDAGDRRADAADRTPGDRVMEQLGGVPGLIFSSLPVLLFVGTSRLLGLAAAAGAALGAATLILLWRLVRRQSVQPAVSGLIGVAVCVLIAYLLGESKGYFLLGIWTSLVWAAVFAVSILIRRPVVGYIWSWLHGHDRGWREQRRAVYAFDIATLTWVLVFGARFVVQRLLYDSNHTGWLVVARISMGWPLAAVAALVTFLAIKAAQRALDDASVTRGGSSSRRSSSSASVTTTNSNSSPPSSGSSSCGTMTRGPRRIVTRAASRGSCKLPHRLAAPRCVVGQRDLDQVGLTPAELHQPDEVADGDGLLDERTQACAGWTPPRRRPRHR